MCYWEGRGVLLGREGGGSDCDVRPTHLSLIQSEQLLEAISVSRSSRPTKYGGRSLILWGTRSRTPKGMYLQLARGGRRGDI